MLFIDTSAFVAIANRGDEYYQEAVSFLKDVKRGKTKFRRLVTSDYIVDETLTRIRFSVGYREALRWGRSIMASKAIEIERIDEEIFQEAWRLFELYTDKPLSFTDCTSIALMEKRDIKSTFAFDEDFEKVGFETLPWHTKLGSKV
ncbi:MAG: PIN domain-containing protein [Candidatus Hydrothermarchaeales archaeon]